MHQRPSLAVRIIQDLPVARHAVMRLWHVGLRLSRTVRARTYFGAEMACNPRDIIQGTIANFGVWEPAVSAAIEGQVRQGEVALDLGGNVGYFSLLLAHLVGQTGQVISVEPMPALAAAIRANALLNGYGTIRVEQAAVSSKSGEVVMYAAPEGNSGATTTLQSRGYEERCRVPARRVVDILTAEESGGLTFIKCDVEGVEVDVLTDVLATLDRFPALRAITVEASQAEAQGWPELFDRLVGAGFDAFALDNDIATTWRELLDRQCPAPPRPVSGMTDRTTDLLFVRR